MGIEIRGFWTRIEYHLLETHQQYEELEFLLDSLTEIDSSGAYSRTEGKQQMRMVW